MGGADAIPGVSGGTIAFIAGIYEELINSIKSIDLKSIRLLLQFKFKAFWEHINGTFLITLVSGIFVSLLSLARIITYVLVTFPIQIWSFFFGLIIISSVLVLREMKQWNWVSILSLMVGIGVAYYISVAAPSHTPDDLWFVFLCGVIAICAMILPGISGAFILLILGKYEYVYTALKDFDILIIGTFGLGCLTGILSFARVISWYLKNYYNAAIGLLSGFMIGSLNKIWPWKNVMEYRINSSGERVPFIEENILPHRYFEITGDSPVLLQALIFAALGVLIVYILEMVARTINSHPQGS